jgi:hypothetical protein
MSHAGKWGKGAGAGMKMTFDWLEGQPFPQPGRPLRNASLKVLLCGANWQSVLFLGQIICLSFTGADYFVSLVGPCDYMADYLLVSWGHWEPSVPPLIGMPVQVRCDLGLCRFCDCFFPHPPTNAKRRI